MDYFFYDIDRVKTTIDSKLANNHSKIDYNVCKTSHLLHILITRRK